MSSTSQIIKRAHATNVAAQYNSGSRPIDSSNSSLRYMLMLNRQSSTTKLIKDKNDRIGSHFLMPSTAAPIINSKRRAQINNFLPMVPRRGLARASIQTVNNMSLRTSMTEIHQQVQQQRPESKPQFINHAKIIKPRTTTVKIMRPEPVEFDITYQPQINLMINETRDAEEEVQQENQAAVESAVRIMDKRRNSLLPSPTKKLQEEICDIISNKSENYEYKSPTKMTSPEKKAFAKQLFKHDDGINLKVQKSLMAARIVKKSASVSIVDSRLVIQTMNEENRIFVESIDRHREAVCNKMSEKYENKPQRIIEPNLSKRMEARKQRVMLAAAKAEAEAEEMENVVPGLSTKKKWATTLNVLNTEESSVLPPRSLSVFKPMQSTKAVNDSI